MTRVLLGSVKANPTSQRAMLTEANRILNTVVSSPEFVACDANMTTISCD
eukprot:gene45699-51528_t